MKESITFLERQVMEALSPIETMNSKIKALKKGMEVVGSSSLD